MRTCLSVGAGPDRVLPRHYGDFRPVTLDIDPDTRPDIVGDVRDLSMIPEESYDAVYMAHLLEHFEAHEVEIVVNQVARILKRDGFVEVRVPHVQAVFDAMADGLDLEDTLYESAMGPIRPLDVIYGHAPSLAAGKRFMAHRTAFTPASLDRALRRPGFRIELITPTPGTRYELCGMARKVAVDVSTVDASADDPAMTDGAQP